MKNLLCLDTSQLQAAVCVVSDSRLKASLQGSVSVAHSEGIMALIDEGLRKAGLELADLDGFAIGVGPGSFTGLRIGIATVKALAQVTGKKVIPFSSLRALVLSDKNPMKAVAIVNAYDKQVFVGWSDSGGVWREEAMTPEAWMRENGARLKQHRAVGSGANLYRDAIGTGLVIDDTLSWIQPSGIAAAALENREKALNPTQVQAHYLRLSAAEAKLANSHPG